MKLPPMASVSKWGRKIGGNFTLFGLLLWLAYTKKKQKGGNFACPNYYYFCDHETRTTKVVGFYHERRLKMGTTMAKKTWIKVVAITKTRGASKTRRLIPTTLCVQNP